MSTREALPEGQPTRETWIALTKPVDSLNEACHSRIEQANSFAVLH